jgi:hypothetical protein
MEGDHAGGFLGHCELVTNLATLAGVPQVEAIWDCEDEELLGAANRLIEHYSGRKAASA